MSDLEFLHGPRASGAELFLHRWPLGYRMRGRGVAPENERTDRTFFADGTRTEVIYHVPRMLYLARWKICVGRHALPALGALWLVGFRLLAYALAVAGVGTLVWLGVRKAHAKVHGRRYVNPLARRTCALVGISKDVPPSEWLSFPADFASNPHGGEIVMTLPASFETANEEKVKRLLVTVAQVLGVSKDDLAVRQKFDGDNPQLVIRIKPPPPASVPWARVQKILATLSDAEILLGIGRGGRHVKANLDHDSPHLLVTSGSGGGKTTTIRAALCQLLKKAAVGVIFDPKVTSHRWARGLPNVALLIKPDLMFHALLALQVEVNRRNELAAESDLEDEQPDTGPRVVIALEEMNTLRAKLTQYWNQIKRLPEWENATTNPAFDALSDLIQMGRFVRMHVILVGQRASVDALGGGTRGGDIRESFFFRVLLQAQAQTWRMLAPGMKTADIPGASRKRGRGHLVYGATHHLFQGVDLTEVQAAQAAVSGLTTAWRDVLPLESFAHGSGTVPVTVSRIGDTGTSGTSGTQPLTKVRNFVAEIAAGVFDRPVTEPPVTLREASSDQGRGIVPNAYESLRAHRRRSKAFPAPVGMNGRAQTFDPVELRFFVANTERSGPDLHGPGANHGLTGGSGRVGEPAGYHVVADGEDSVGDADTEQHLKPVSG